MATLLKAFWAPCYAAKALIAHANTGCLYSASAHKAPHWCRNAIVPPRPSDMASSLSDTESLDAGGLGPPSSSYTASLQPLKGQGPESPKAAALASDALLEQFERAQQYVARHPEDFSLEHLSSLQAGLSSVSVL